MVVIWIEIVLAIVGIGLSILLFYKKNRKRAILFSLLTVLLFVISIGFTLLITKPFLRTTEILLVEVNSEKELPKPSTTYFFRNITKQVKIKGKIDRTKLGNYEIEYIVPILFGTYKQKQKVQVVDTTAPVITLNGEEYIESSYAKEYEELGATALDNYDGDLTAQIQIEKKQLDADRLEIIYKVKDQNQNEGKKVRTIVFVDDVPPVLTLNGQGTMTLYLGSSYQEPGATSLDEKDGDLTEQIKIEGSVDTAKVGTYSIVYTSEDHKGNKAVKERKVRVISRAPQMNGTGSTIYLTFDDGPSAFTGRLLDILGKYNVKATFFVTNQSLTNGYDSFITRAYQEGHTIGLHTYTHTYQEVYRSEEAYFNDLYAIQKKVKDLTGYESKIIRFPGGSSNTVSRFNPGIMSRLTVEVEKRGFRYFDWNLSSGDAGGAITADQVRDNVIGALGNRSSYVVLQHDVKGYSVDAVEGIIEYGLSHGYTFDALHLDSYGSHHRVNN